MTSHESTNGATVGERASLTAVAELFGDQGLCGDRQGVE